MTVKPIEAMTCSGGSRTPYGRSAMTFSSGTNTSSMVMSLLAVPRMPIVSHVSWTVTPGSLNGIAMLRTRRPRSGSSYGNIVDITVPAGDWLAKILCPLTRYPPSTFVAVPRGRVKSAPPVETSTMPSSATRRSVASAPGMPRR